MILVVYVNPVYSYLHHRSGIGCDVTNIHYYIDMNSIAPSSDRKVSFMSYCISSTKQLKLIGLVEKINKREACGFLW